MTTAPVLATQAPFSQEAEEAVLGAILINPDAYLTIASFLQTDDFFILRHRHIWEALSRISQRNEKPDFVTVQDELRAMGVLGEIGGPAFILNLINNTPTSIHAEVYARLVERASTRRKLLAAADQIKGLALNETLNLERVVSESESRLFGVTENTIRRDIQPIGNALNEYFERVELLMQSPAAMQGLPTGFRDLDQLLGGLQRSDLLIFAGRPGMGKCVTGDTLVATERGLVPIESLKPANTSGVRDDEGGVFYPLGIAVQTPDGWRKAAFFYDSGVKPTRRMQTRAGYALSGTFAHPVLTLTHDGEKAWKTLGDIEPGDYVAVQRHGALWGDETRLPDFTFEFNRSGFTLRPALPTQMTPDLAYVLGMLTGDGNLTRKNYVNISSSDAELLSAFYNWIESVGLKARHRADYDHTVGSVVLNTWLKHIGLAGYAHEKVVPYTVMRAPKESVVAFLQGLFDTDGHAEAQRGYIQFVSASKRLAEQIHLLLLQFGIISKLTFKPNARRGAWSIRITGAAARTFYATIGFRLARKQARQYLLPETANANLDVVPYLPHRITAFPKHVDYQRYFLGRRSPTYPQLEKIARYAPEVVALLEPQFYWDEVVSAEDAGLQHCYDLTVPEGHAFASNGIVSHNTSFLLSVALNAAKVGARIAIFTMEMGADQIVQRFVAMETGINTQKLRTGQLTPQEYSKFVHSAGTLGGLPIFIDDTPSMTPVQMRTKCRRVQHEYGLDLVIVDYLQLMNGGGTFENNRVQEISYISRSMKEMARELQVPVFSAAQLSRAVEQRQDKHPQLSDLRESGCLAGESLIYLPDTGEYVPIRDLQGQSGFCVTSLNTATWKLERTEVVRAWCTGVKPVFRLTTQLGRTIRATGNHKFLTIDGWKRLDELTAADRIALPRQLPGPQTKTMEEAELALLGHLIGDGCTLPGHAIQYTTREEDLAHIVTDLATQVFGERVRPRVCREPGHNWYQVFIPSAEHLTHRVHTPVRNWMQELGCFGLRSYEKHVPAQVFQQPADSIAIFLRHLWATDGHVGLKPVRNSHYPTIYYATSSARLAMDVQSLLLRLGINARYTCVPQAGKGRNQFHVTLSGQDDFRRYMDRIGAIGQRRNASLEAIRANLETHIQNTNRDIIPREVWRKFAVPAMSATSLTVRQMQAALGNAYCGTGLYKQNISRERGLRLAQVVQSEPLARLARSDVYWDAIAAIEPDGESEVFDLTVPQNQCFVAENVIVHNSLEQDADIVAFLYREVVYNEATENPNKAEVIIAKHRNGPTDTVSLHYERQLTKFLDARPHKIDLAAY